ncbi:MAG TPA: hypothetical protein PK359_12730 [Burkholderiaceae bacterium]|jgi:hypothetical protein|nr:hypothetical protein [Burkholderiaceae bacterium]
METTIRIARSVRIGCAALLCCLAAPLAAQQVYWYDGAVRRPLWAEPGVVADFSGATSEKSQVIRPYALSKAEGGHQSPVYRDQAQGGATRALPGGVIVRFKAGSTDSDIAALAARHGLTLQRRIGDLGTTYLVACPPGEPSLALANRLFESGDFEAASPNWWQPRQLK